MSETDPPDDDMEMLAAEVVLGLLTRAQMPHVVAWRHGSVRFDQAVRRWELLLLPLTEALEPVRPSPRVWSGISRAITAESSRGGLWDNLRFWRGLSLAAGALCAVLVAGFFLHSPVAPATFATATLASKTEGVFVATAEASSGGTRLVVSPLQVTIPGGKSAELWLIAPGKNPAPLGLLASGNPVILSIPAGLSGDIRTAELAVSIEPPGGSPTGLPTGPVIAAAKFLPL